MNGCRGVGVCLGVAGISNKSAPYSPNTNGDVQEPQKGVEGVLSNEHCVLATGRHNPFVIQELLISLTS